MAATAAMAAELRRMVDESTEVTYNDALVDAIIEKYPLIDALGTDPQDVDFTTTPPTITEKDEWIPTYDLNAAAAQIWEEKAAAIADEFTFSADGGSFSRSKKHDQYKLNARTYSSKKSAQTIKVYIVPRKIKQEESNSD